MIEFRTASFIQFTRINSSRSAVYVINSSVIASLVFTESKSILTNWSKLSEQQFNPLGHCLIGHYWIQYLPAQLQLPPPTYCQTCLSRPSFFFFAPFCISSLILVLIPFYYLLVSLAHHGRSFVIIPLCYLYLGNIS